MSTFTDDFNRGDGGVGNNWQAATGAISIASNHMVTTGATTAYNTTINASGRQECIGVIDITTNAELTSGPLLKFNVSPRNGYCAYGSGLLSAPLWHVRRITSGAFATDFQANGSGLSAGSHTLRLLYDSGILNFWVDGALILTVADSTHGAYTGAGWFANAGNAALNTYTLLGDETVTLAVTPDPIGNFNNSTAISIVGVGTSWTPGTPGTPTFTVDHGTLSNQEVLTATTASATYTPGNFLGIATFSDPSTGATCQVSVSSDTTVISPPGGGFTPQAVAMVNNTAGESYLELLTKPNTPVMVDAFSEIELVTLLGRVGLTTGAKVTPVGVPDAGLLDLLWQLVNASTSPATGPWQHASGVPLSEQLGDLLERWNTLITGNEYTLGTVITTLAGEGVPTHKDIIDGLSSVQFDDSAIIAAIEAARGEDLPSIRTAVDLIGALSTIAGYDLSDVLTSIEAVRGSGLPTIKNVMDKLLLIQPGNTPDLVTIDTHIVQQTTLQAIMDLAVGSLRGGNTGATITGVLDAIDDLSSNLPTAGGAPTLWPGEALVDLGTEVAIVDGMTVTGPMHGLLMTVTAQPVRYQVYQFGDVNSWARVGAVIFGTDRDDYERSQTFGLDRQILNPQTMEVAASAIIRINEGWEGTVRTWKRST